MSNLDPIFSALSNPTRRAIIARLREGEATAGALGAPFALSQPTISAHLKVLEEAGLVTRTRHGTERPVRLAAEAIEALDQWVAPFRALWEPRLDRLEAFAKSLEVQERKNDDP